MNKLIYACVCAFFLSIMTMVYADSIEQDLADHLIRLHIIANSDSEYDQGLKLEIRDRVIAGQKAFMKSGQRDTFSQTIARVEQTANAVLEEAGVPYRANAYYGDFQFPQKEYANITLPAGMYRGVRIVLGEGAGKNWWCVMMPPLCFTQSAVGELDQNGEAALEGTLQPETLQVIKGEGIQYQYKLKIVETIKNIIQ